MAVKNEADSPAGTPDLSNQDQRNNVTVLAKYGGLVFISGVGAHFEGDITAHTKHVLDEVQKKLDELNAAAHRTGADLAVNQDRLVEEMRGLRGKLEEAQHRLDLLEQATAALKGDTEGRFAALKGAGALEEYEARKKAADLKRPADKAAFLALAQKQEQAGEKGVARELYEEYVKKWPSDPRSADAWFRLGELAHGDKRYREAVLAFGKVVQDFPRSDKAPDALLRTGVANIFGVNFSGFIAWWLWRTIYLSKLPGLDKKVRVAFDWTLDLLFRKDVCAIHDLPSRAEFHRREHRRATIGDNSQYWQTAEVEATLEGVNP